MKNSLVIFALLCGFLTRAQHYYNDITGARDLSQRWATFTGQLVRSVTATGYDNRGVKSTDFNEWQEINRDNRTLKVITRNGLQMGRQTFQFDESGRLTGISDTSGDIRSKTVYSYENDRIISIITNTRDSLNDFSQTIAHHYLYNTNGQPQRLWRVVNGNDSTEYRFTVDAEGRVTDERLYRRGLPMDLIYYYYDQQGRLTDIVRYDKRTKKLLPTTLFEYDDSGRLIQKMSVLSTNRPDYVIWRYVFNEKGLKTKEALFNKQKELTGRIDYAYTFEN